jgi:endonuclease/exonuclease/phosphatase family metal-dependent hydrolase
LHALVGTLLDMDSPEPVDRVRVLTHNILARQAGWEKRRPVLIDGLRALAPDLVAFQESVIADDYDQVLDLLGPEFHVAHHATRDADGMGISIASRWPFDSVHQLDLGVTERSRGFPIGTIAAEVLAPDPVGRLLFVNHFPSWQLTFEHERELQAVAAAGFIDELLDSRRLPVVLAGDMDADPRAASIRFWTGRQALGGTSVCYLDAWERLHGNEPGDTFTPRNPIVTEFVPDWPFRRIDYILLRCLIGSPRLAIDRCEIVFDEPVGGVWPSDHFGVMADLVAR